MSRPNSMTKKKKKIPREEGVAWHVVSVHHSIESEGKAELVHARWRSFSSSCLGRTESQEQETRPGLLSKGPPLVAFICQLVIGLHKFYNLPKLDIQLGTKDSKHEPMRNILYFKPWPFVKGTLVMSPAFPALLFYSEEKIHSLYLLNLFCTRC